MCVQYVCESACLCAHTSEFVCGALDSFIVWVSVLAGWLGLGVVCRILDKVGALPKCHGWRNWLFFYFFSRAYR